MPEPYRAKKIRQNWCGSYVGLGLLDSVDIVSVLNFAFSLLARVLSDRIGMAAFETRRTFPHSSFFVGVSDCDVSEAMDELMDEPAIASAGVAGSSITCSGSSRSGVRVACSGAVTWTGGDDKM